MKKILFYLALIVLILAVIPALATVTKEGEDYTEQDYNCMGGGHVTATTYSADTLDGWNGSAMTGSTFSRSTIIALSYSAPSLGASFL